MPFQPSKTLLSRTFIGLLLSQFLAAFNDQAIHAAAMFYAINQHALSEDKAISLMPILFFAPWAIFCTLAGYLADRYSKRHSLVFWKVAEIVITVVALAGFWMGTTLKNPVGPWIVLSTVFLMGMHSAFFVPAKYGVMPEILPPHLLSKGNGILESTSFLAAILGTVTGGILSFVFRGREYWIGLILVVLAVIGALGSLLIRRMPAADPHRPFPTNLFKPLYDNLRLMVRSRPLALAVLGIAFFTFIVAFMRATVYMHGESRNPRWTEFETSLVVGIVALGVGLGSPLAGLFSGGKVELGLVPLGAVGMILATVAAALTLEWIPGLVTCIVLIGFFTGFYIVPLFTLLQHRAPKTSKGDLIATSNFINVTGAIVASLLFFLLVLAAKGVGIARSVPQQEFVRGELTRLQLKRGGHPAYIEVRRETDGLLVRLGQPVRQEEEDLEEVFQPSRPYRSVLKVQEGVQEGSQVAVSTYYLRQVDHYEIRPAAQDLHDAYDQALVPQFLFFGAALMSLVTLILLCRQLPDLFLRALLWLRSRSRYHLKVIGQHNLPSDGPVLLATNCDDFDSCMQVVAATDRTIHFILLEAGPEGQTPRLLGSLARGTGLVTLQPGVASAEAWDVALAKALKGLGQGHLVGVTVDSQSGAGNPALQEVEPFVQELLAQMPVGILPIYCGSARGPAADNPLLHETDGQPPGDSVPGLHPAAFRHRRVVIGYPLPPQASLEEIRRTIRMLGDWLHATEKAGGQLTTVMIPKASSASPTETVPDLPAPP
jgi:MFS family permease